MKYTKREILGSMILFVGVVLLFGAVGTNDIRSVVSGDAGLASESSVWLMLFAGAFLISTGAFILNKKGGRHG